MKKLFNATFEQSTKIAMRRDLLFLKNDYRQINYNWYPNRILMVLMLMGFFLMEFGFDVMAEMSRNDKFNYFYPQSNVYIYYIEKLIHPIFILTIVVAIIFTLRLLLPIKNITVFMNVGWVVMPLLAISGLLSMLPVLLGGSFGNGGIVYTVLSIILVLSFEGYRLKSWVSEKINKMYDRPKKTNQLDKLIGKIFGLNTSKKDFNKFIYVLVRLIVILFLINLIGIYEIWLQHNSFEIQRVLICDSVPLVCIMLLELVRVGLSVKLTWYYIKKYPTQYRLYYKISDKLWYLSEKRAAKHPHVYPPVEGDKGTNK